MGLPEQTRTISDKDWQEWSRLKVKEEALLKRASEEFKNFPISLRDDILNQVPSVKRDEIVSSVKHELIQMRLAKAQQELVDLNSQLISPKVQQEIADLKVQYRNFHRQLAWNKINLVSIDGGKPVNDKNGLVMYRWEIEFMIDKLGINLEHIEKRMAFWGLKPEDVLKE